ncbi:MAG: cytidine deaminase [Bacteroidales bacterium]
MKKVSILTEIFETNSPDDLNIEDQKLIEAALNAAGSSWSPYSGFAVGAAVRLTDGSIVPGCNIENAAFPSGICAEHNALSSAAALFPGIAPSAIAITAVKEGVQVSLPVSPCGKCRQIIAEEESRHNKPLRIILAGSSKVTIIGKGSDLLPLTFSHKDLNPDPR